MHATDIKLNKLFNGSVRFLMPMFQRPYVWDEEKEWAPLWEDIRAVAELVLAAGGKSASLPSHFLGAIVTEQVATFGTQTMTVIDGQQRLTTLQLVMDAAERVVDELGDASDAKDLRSLILNTDEDDEVPDNDTRFKVWPTNRDREAFVAAMDDHRPVSADLVGTRIVRAHDYFSAAIREWALAAGDGESASRLAALTKALRTKLSLVAISLGQGDNAQVIFESLNFRGTPLLAADLIKNHLFQRAQAEGRDLESLHKHYWAEFDGDGTSNDYWREQVRQGRLIRPRLDAFLGHYLVMRLQREVSSDRIFADFRDEVSAEEPNVERLMAELHSTAKAYRAFMDTPVSTVEGKFRYRVLDALDANAVMPVVLWVLTHDVPADQERLALESLESWLVRRAVLKLGVKDLTHFSIEMVRHLAAGDPEHAGESLREFLVEQTTPARLWPDDEAFVEALTTSPIYRSTKRSVNRLLLEAAEESIRTANKSESTVCPPDLSVEHVMPQAWALNWPLTIDDPAAVERRNLLVQTLGNLTLVTGSVNSSLSNRPWTADDKKGKRDHLFANATLKLNAELWQQEHWEEKDIEARGTYLAGLLVSTWPRPAAGMSTSSLLEAPTRKTGTRAGKAPVYEIHGPGVELGNLSRRAVVHALIHALHEHGVPMERMDQTLQSVRLRWVEGRLDGQELFDELVRRHNVNPDHPGWWFLDTPIHDAGRTWVINADWGNALHRRLDDLSVLHEGFGWSTTAKLKGAAWSQDDVQDALVEDAELAEFVRALIEGIDALGGRARGTAAGEPSIALGVPGHGGEVWPFAIYTGEPENPLRLSFRFVARPDGSDERFLARIAPLLPSLDADALRMNDFKGWPAVSRRDLLVDGVAEALVAAAEEYLGDGDTRRWWCVHNTDLPGHVLEEGGFVSVDWAGVGDLRSLGNDRDLVNRRLRVAYPGQKEGAYTNWTGMLIRFAFDMKPGDYVISPVKASRTVDLGVVSGSYWFEDGEQSHQHRVPIAWLATGIPRDDFSADARHEIGGALTLFRVKRNATEFADRLEAANAVSVEDKE